MYRLLQGRNTDGNFAIPMLGRAYARQFAKAIFYESLIWDLKIPFWNLPVLPIKQLHWLQSLSPLSIFVWQNMPRTAI
jgi:hypothetical protein